MPPVPVRRSPLWLIALITITGTMAMHIFVPALPTVSRDLNASAHSAQMTLSFYIVGLAFGQLLYGPISDRFGRRPVLIFGLIVYAASSLAALWAATIETLIVLRLFQALGACAGLVLGRAIVRDSSTGDQTARNLSVLNLLIMAGPGLSPMIGSALAESLGWRSIFAVLAAVGVINLLLTVFLLRETVVEATRGFTTVLRNYALLLGSRRFLASAFGGACATTSIYAFVGAAPFIYINQLGRTAHEVGIYLAVNIVGVWFGNVAAIRLLGRIRVARLMVMGNALSCFGAAIFFVAAVTGHLSVTLTLAPMVILTFGAGIASPMAMSEALAVNPAVAGSSSGIYGFTQMAIGAVCTALAGLGHDPAVASASTLLGAGLLAQLSFWVAQRSSKPGAAPQP